MNNQELIQQTTKLVKRDFEMEARDDEFLTEDELLNSLARHVAYMIEYQIENLMSSLYRMDVQEKKVREVFHPDAPEPTNIGIARLIIERQKQRVATKQAYQPPKNDDWFDF